LTDDTLGSDDIVIKMGGAMIDHDDPHADLHSEQGA
jgi:hypothetical protein